MSAPIIMHVNYCEQGQTLPEMCRKAVDWGYDGIEFRRRRTGTREEPEAYLDAVARAADDAGLKYVLFGGPGVELMTDDAARRGSEVESAVAFYRMAASKVRLTVCNIMSGSLRNPDKGVPGGEYHRHGSSVATEKHYDWAAEGFKVLGRLAEELGFRFAFEIHMGYLHDLPAPTKKLLERIGSPAVGALLDHGNVVYFPGAPALKDSIPLLGKHLFYVHLKNSMGLRDGGRFPVGLGDGEINHREYLRLLKENGFSGPICVEAPRQGDREWYARQDIAYIKALIHEVWL
jgi:sugar phosphate isomerase/epimerase